MTHLSVAQEHDENPVVAILQEIQSLSRQIGSLKNLVDATLRAGVHIAGTEQYTRDEAALVDQADALGRIYRNRRKRDWVFRDYDFFHDPAWDILLDVTIAEHKGIKLPVSSVCIGASVPATTALRWISLLEDKGLLFRENDPEDSRRSYVRPTEEALALMGRYVAAI